MSTISEYPINTVVTSNGRASLAEYFAEKHFSLKDDYKGDCLVVAREIATRLLDLGKQPYIMMLTRFEQRGENKYYGPIMPIKYRGRVTWTKHYVCCCDERVFDPMHHEPINVNEYSQTIFAIKIPMEVFVPTVEMNMYLAKFA